MLFSYGTVTASPAPGSFIVVVPFEDAKALGATEASTLVLKSEGKPDVDLNL